MVLTDMGQDAVDSLAQDLGSRALAIAADVTDQQAMEDAVAAAVAEFGGVDVLFANAGIAARPSTINDADADEFERVINVDLLGVWRSTRAALPQIIARQGHVVMTASIYATVNGAINAPYAMSKAGVEQFGRALRTELTIHGASAGVLYPGWVDTDIASVAFGAHDVATRMCARAYPGPYGKTVNADRVARATCDGIERRAARTIVPRRWLPVMFASGIINPLSDRWLERDKVIREGLREIEFQ